MENMGKTKVTADTIIDYLQTQIEEKQIFNPNIWIDAAMKLNVLLGDESDKLVKLEQEVATLKWKYIQADVKGNVSKAKAQIETSDLYREMKSQAAKIERIIEFIRLSKVQARMRDEEFRSN